MMEWLNELIGFLIVLFIFLFPFLRALLLKKQKKKEPPPPFAEKVEEEEDWIEEEPPPPPEPSKAYKTQRLVKKDFEFHSDVEEREFESKIEERYIETGIDPEFKDRIVSDAFLIEPKRKRRTEKNPVDALLKGRDPLQAMVIFSEVLGRPKGDP